jgi:hypothetical protein
MAEEDRQKEEEKRAEYIPIDKGFTFFLLSFLGFAQVGSFFTNFDDLLLSGEYTASNGGTVRGTRVYPNSMLAEFTTTSSITQAAVVASTGALAYARETEIWTQTH